MLLAITAMLLGIIVGLGFRVLILLPIVATLMIGLPLNAFYNDLDFVAVCQRMLGCACAIQLGYLAGAYLRQFAAERRGDRLAPYLDI